MAVARRLPGRLLTGRPFPLLVADLSFDDDPRGVRAFSYDDQNRHLPNPLPVGTLVWTRDLADPTGTETLAEITEVEKDGWPTPFWVYYLRQAGPPICVVNLAAAAGCTVEELLGGAEVHATSQGREPVESGAEGCWTSCG